AIAHQTRYSPRLERIREMIRDGVIGDILELRGRGKEDSRGGGQDLMVLGTHIMDLMRFVAGDVRWCYARVAQDSRPVTKIDVVQGREAMGPVAGNQITAAYGFDKNIQGHFATYRPRPGDKGASRFGLTIHGARGIIQFTTGSLPPAYLLEDPTWFP